MPLQDIVEQQLEDLRFFLEYPKLSLRCLRHEPDIKRLVGKLLSGLENEADNPHIFLALSTPFINVEQFFIEALAELQAQNENFTAELAGLDYQWPQAEENPELAPRLCFERYVSAVADSFPDYIGAYAIVFDPESIDNPAGFRKAMAFLARHTQSEWVKYLVLDDYREPLLKGIEEHCERADVQAIHISPEQIEQQIERDLEENNLSAQDHRHYMALAGAMAFARKDYAEARKRQIATLRTAKESGSPGEQAHAFFNLGNTYLAAESYPEAEGCFSEAAELCIQAELNPLLAMVLCNLGVTLHRLQRLDEALQSFDIARATFHAINNPPGEAHALDCKAATLAEAQCNSEAEQTWLDAIAVYDGIDNPAMADAKEGGRKDLTAKLDRFYEQTGQASQAKAA